MQTSFLSDNFVLEGNVPATCIYERAVRGISAGHGVTVITCAPYSPEGKCCSRYCNRWRQEEALDDIPVLRVKPYNSANEGFLRHAFDYLSFMLMAICNALFERGPEVGVATSPQFFWAAKRWLPHGADLLFSSRVNCGRPSSAPSARYGAAL